MTTLNTPILGTIKDVCDLLGFKLTWVKARIRNDPTFPQRIKFGKSTRYSLPEVRAWAEKQMNNGGTASLPAVAKPTPLVTSRAEANALLDKVMRGKGNQAEADELCALIVKCAAPLFIEVARDITFSHKDANFSEMSLDDARKALYAAGQVVDEVRRVDAALDTLRDCAFFTTERIRENMCEILDAMVDIVISARGDTRFKDCDAEDHYYKGTNRVVFLLKEGMTCHLTHVGWGSRLKDFIEGYLYTPTTNVWVSRKGGVYYHTIEEFNDRVNPPSLEEII